MTGLLPITITVDQALLDSFDKIQSVCNKLEAQFNFQTLTANWYGDEENVLTVTLLLLTPDTFYLNKQSLAEQRQTESNIISFSDDVICSVDNEHKQFTCFIALTKSELLLLESEPKLLKGLIQTKLHKILNLVAQQQSLALI